MNITTLKDSPQYASQAFSLVEKAFKYTPEFSFRTDFSLLVNERNHHHCYVAIENGKVLAHVGYLEKEISLAEKTFRIGLLGGIAVDETQRGKGIFSQIFTHVLSDKRDDVAFFLLWSDLEKLYNKFGFYLCGQQYEMPKTQGESSYVKTNLLKLTPDEMKDIFQLHSQSFSDLYVTFKRDVAEWIKLKEITSAELYIKKNGSKVVNYFFKNKGQDLAGIIYEYGKYETELTYSGKVWLGLAVEETESIQYQFFMAPGATQLFASFINSYSQGKIIIRDINLMKQEVYFDFNGETISLETEDFLRGIFGPGIFEEFGELKPMYISGLDSI